MNIKKFFFTFLLLTVFTSSYSLLTRAETSTFSQDLNGRGMILSPGIQYFEGDRGQTLTGKFNLRNDIESKIDVTIYPTVVNVLQKEDGSPEFDTSQRSLDFDFAKWFTLEKNEFGLQSRQNKEFTYTIKIPANATGGTHTAFILFPRVKDANAQLNNATGLNDQLGLPVFLTIKKDIDFKGSIKDMYTTDISNNKKSTFFYGNEVTHIIVDNPGNIYIRPFGNVFIHKGDTTKPIKTLDFNPNGTLVQQRSKREYQFEFSTNGFINESEKSWLSFKKYRFTKFFDFRFGRYYATYQAIIKPANEAGFEKEKGIIVDQTVSFYVFPIQIIFVIVLVIILLGGYITLRSMKSRKNQPSLKSLKKRL